VAGESSPWERDREDLSGDALAILAAFGELRNTSTNRRESKPPTLKDAAKQVRGASVGDVESFRQKLERLGEYLAQDTGDGSAINLLRTVERRASFATADALLMSEAAASVLERREAEWEERRLLEDLQLVSAVDSRALRIGGYPAHFERFLGRLVGRLHETFPWIKVELRFIESRAREGGGALQQMFEPAEGGEPRSTTCWNRGKGRTPATDTPCA
jgi:hypothetical protein